MTTSTTYMVHTPAGWWNQDEGFVSEQFGEHGATECERRGDAQWVAEQHNGTVVPVEAL